jgi:DNA-binding NarL/FixJ family response regulator
MINVVVVDDHAVVREGLKRIISENPGMAVSGEAGDGFEAMKVVRENPCDVVLLDITMPNKNGLDVLKQIHAGYLTKESAPAKLVQAIRKVVRGGKYVSQTLAEKLVFDLDSDMDRIPHETLSDREFQVLCMIASGKTVGDIAEELALSVKTISTYRVRILEKLQMKNNAEITRYAIKQGLVD